jgi:hypothetical protein
MKRGSVGLVLFAFVLGVFVGIWLDWSAWRHTVATRDLVYQVQDYAEANLLVKGGDTITLAPPNGTDPSLTMSFVGYSPCVGQSAGPQPINLCVIDSTAPSGPYFFTCSSTYNPGLTCPDPGIQQPPTEPMRNLSYPRFVKTDFAHLLGLHRAATKEPPPPATTPTTPAATPAPFRAYVSCPGSGPTQLQDLNGNKLTTINASTGQSVYWLSTKQFSMDTSGGKPPFPSNLCSNGNPQGPYNPEAQCDSISATVAGSYQYTITAQGCSLLPALLSVSTNTKSK